MPRLAVDAEFAVEVGMPAALEVVNLGQARGRRRVRGRRR